MAGFKAQDFPCEGIPQQLEATTPADWLRITHAVGMNFSATEAALEELGNMFRYQGMDPIRILKRFAEIGRAAGRNWAKDAVFLISLHICRGTKVAKILKSVPEEAVPEITDVTNIYHIKDSKPVGDDITLARLALCFPLFTLRQLSNFRDQLTVQHHTMTDISPGYPIELMHPAFASLIWTSEEQVYNDLLDAHRLYLVELTRVINPEMRTKRVREIVDSFNQPLQAGVNSTFIDQNHRKISLVKLGVMNNRGVLIPEVTRAAEMFRRRLAE